MKIVYKSPNCLFLIFTLFSIFKLSTKVRHDVSFFHTIPMSKNSGSARFNFIRETSEAPTITPLVDRTYMWYYVRLGPEMQQVQI